MRPFARVVALTIAFAVELVLGCSNASKDEALALAEKLERYQKSDRSASAAAASAIASQPCSDPEVCEAKRACLAFVEPMVKDVELQRETAKAVEDLAEKKRRGELTRDDTSIPETYERMNASARLRTQSLAARDDCERKVLALHKKYGF